MQPKIISETIQEFDDIRYYLCGKYFQRKGKRLHIAVWEFHHGSIPAGHHVHHKDNDRANNEIGNLECITSHEHQSGRHGKESGERGKRNIHRAYAAAAAWHGTSEGRQWHSEHFAKRIKPTMDRRVKAICQQCGREYLVSTARIQQGKFCGPNCKARALRKRRKLAKG